jgi:hypothetical protein
MWKYTNNQFLTVAEKSYKKGLILSNYHNAALLKFKTSNPTDTDIDKLYTRYNPLAQALATAYQQWKGLGGVKEASTLNLDQLLATIPTKLNVWDPAIQGKFIKTTPEYKAILPNGRSGLTRGNKEDKVIAVKTLSESLNGITSLAAIKTQIDTFYAQILAARTTQLGSKSAMNQGSDAVSVAIESCMIMQYRNLGLLIDKYADNADLIESFFDLQTLQESTQTSFTGTLDPAENEAVLVHTFMTEDELRLKIIGDAAAKFYLSNTTNGTNSTAVEVAANTQVIIAVDDFAVSDYNTCRYLTVVNTSNSITTKYEVEVL